MNKLLLALIHSHIRPELVHQAWLMQVAISCVINQLHVTSQDQCQALQDKLACVEDDYKIMMQELDTTIESQRLQLIDQEQQLERQNALLARNKLAIGSLELILFSAHLPIFFKENP